MFLLKIIIPNNNCNDYELESLDHLENEGGIPLEVYNKVNNIFEVTPGATDNVPEDHGFETNRQLITKVPDENIRRRMSTEVHFKKE